MTAAWSKFRRQASWASLGAMVCSLVLTACGVKAQASITTRFNSMGGGQNSLLLTVPVEAYSGDILDRLPNLALLTGVEFHDFREGGQQGVRISQTFYGLRQLNGNPEAAHFLNRAFPGSFIRYHTSWRPNWFTRDLHVEMTVDAASSAGLAKIIASTTAGVLDTSIVLELPGEVISHNGTQLSEQTIVWPWRSDQPQTLLATARVVSWPLVWSLGFNVSAGLAALLTGRPVSSRRASGRSQPGRPVSTSRPPRR